MKNKEAQFYILLSIFCVIQLGQCKVAQVTRRQGDGGINEDYPHILESQDEGPGLGSNEEPPNLLDTQGADEDQPNEQNNQITDEEIGPGTDGDNPNIQDYPGTAKDNPNIQDYPDEDNPNVLDNKGDRNVPLSGLCWIKLKPSSYIDGMKKLDQKYKAEREAYAREVDTKRFDKRMLDAMTKTRGIAEREVDKVSGNLNLIPAGLNLGTNCMVRMPGSILFFYRMKLRNNTRFVVNYIHNDVDQLTLTMRLSLNDLHLVGEYERALISKEDDSKLYYKPNKGGVEILLKDVKYKVEGRYRLLEDRLHVEHIISEIPPMKILMRYTADPDGNSVPLEASSLKDYLAKMKNNLDFWLKDYFNDFLMLYGFEEAKKNQKIQQYQNERIILMNQFSDQTLGILNRRLREIGAASLIMPDFTLTAANGMEIKLHDGAVSGVDSMYRRSVTTGKDVDRVNYIDADIGFSGLKVEYRYDTYMRTGLPPLSGMLVLNTDDVSAHVGLQIASRTPGAQDLRVSFLRYGKPEALTVEGPANRLIANFKHLLEHHIISIMTSTLMLHIRSLGSLIKCEPNLPGKDLPGRIESGDDDEGPNEPPQPSDSDEPTEPPQPSDGDRPSEPAQPSDGDEPSQPSQHSDGGGSNEPPQLSDGDGPSEPAQPSDDDGSNEPPQPSDGNGPNEPPQPSDGVEPSEPSQHSDGGGSNEPPQPSDGDGPSEPAQPSDDDGPNEAPQPSDDDAPDEPPQPSDDDGPNEPAQPSDDDGQGDDPNELKPDYAFARKESIELELPPKPGSVKGDRMKIDHSEKFSLSKLKDEGEHPKGMMALSGNLNAGGSNIRGKIIELPVEDRR